MIRKPKGKIVFSEIIDIGLCRRENQDAIYSATNGDSGLFVLADGMGGHKMGDLASGEIIASCKKYIQHIQEQDKMPDFLTMTQEVTDMLRATNEYIYKEYNREGICGSTVVLLLIKKDCYAVFSVGDSRVYTFYQGEMELLTIDDTWDNLPATRQNYTQDQIERDVRHGKLVQAIGTGREVTIHVTTNRIKRGQCFFLCSDGLYRYCSEAVLQEGMKNCVSEKMTRVVLDRYKKEVYSNGAKDNMSGILVCVG